jgi:hypothetical protein
METVKPYPDAYEDCVVVQKLREGERHLLVFDKNFTIQRHAHPVEDPPESEIAAGKEMRRITAEYPVIFSSAQTLELTVDSDVYSRSVAAGYCNRRPPRIKLPDGTVTTKPEDVEGWEYLLNPDAFIGFGTGIYPRKNGAYRRDVAFEDALGGRLWRPQFFNYLDELYPNKSYREHLTPVDREDEDADVAAPEWRVEFLHEGDTGRDERDALMVRVTAAQLRGKFTKNMRWIDESNPLVDMYRSYAVPLYGVKDLALEHFGNQVAIHAKVPMEEIAVTVFGDAPPDLESGLGAFSGAKDVRLVIPSKSRISESIVTNTDFAGMPLPGCPNHPTLPGRFCETKTPGVLWWYGAQGQRARQVIVAEYTPWGEGLECTESVLATLKHLKIGS